MEGKHKNALIGGLLAIVFIMAVGFAGFTQQLTINDSATVSSNWSISFDSAEADKACAGNDTTACGTVTSFDSGATQITFQTKLFSPGDTVTYTVKVKNAGNVAALLDSFTMQETDSANLIEYTQTGLTEDVTTVGTSADSNTIEFDVTVTFKQTAGAIEAQSDGLTMTLNWIQA